MKLKEQKSYSVTFSEKEFRLLVALADFPDWAAQSESIQEFLSALAYLDPEDHQSAEEAGYVGAVSF